MNRQLRPGQRSRIHIIDVITGDTRVVHESDSVLYEAPNWTQDGGSLIVNGDGHLFRIALSDGSPERIDLGAVPDLNNDHVLDPDGEHVYFSAEDGHIYRGSLAGGSSRRITNAEGRRHFLHGVSPDGSNLAYVGIEQNARGDWAAGNIRTISTSGINDLGLTDDRFPDDGAEYSPDGQWLYFNSERASATPGHAQLFRMRPDGTGIEQLTDDDRVNWFPHPSPNGTMIAFISFPPRTEGHPADLDCVIRICGPRGENVHDIVGLFGGQGTINVPSWSPDSRSIAYVDYPLAR